MDWKHWLFGFEGRINRAKFWLGILVSLVIPIAVVLPIAVLQGSDLQWVAITVLGIAAGIIVIWIGLAIGVKRLHDRNKSGWWLLLYYVLPGALNSTVEAVYPDDIPENADLGSLSVVLAVSLISFAISIWALVDLGILKGTQGPNRFGADPLGARQADASL